ncbi:TetR/AcrR family transcriptional regulator [Viridibacillus sp. YIM B01967]|uniref:TetR/AcrR family transcriptional regulator n=1 Tax=Viridibacillus soli TaxID=2798301 RepID=A0ABS1H9R1_9BACL|nr:TetR/AcrR family transcriptional regulator [Viridibacillus soli]MBK3495852.1 TetR/AcrR family transcriptional regulator [Viridibacillus soli]
MPRERKFSTDEIFNTTQLLLMKYGYEGFTFSLLARALDVSRAAIYKYYMNKEELILDYMNSTMQEVYDDLQSIDQQATFQVQLDELLTKIYQYKDLHQIFEMTYYIQENASEIVMQKKTSLKQITVNMYDVLQKLIEQGKKERFLNKKMPRDLILVFMLRSISTPNRLGFAQEEWIRSIKELICYGIAEQKISDTNMTFDLR